MRDKISLARCAPSISIWLCTRFNCSLMFSDKTEDEEHADQVTVIPGRIEMIKRLDFEVAYSGGGEFQEESSYWSFINHRVLLQSN